MLTSNFLRFRQFPLPWSPGGHLVVTAGLAMKKTLGLQKKLTKSVVDTAEPCSARYIIWDGVLPGFGLRITPNNTKCFVLRYRPHRGGRSAPKRFITIGHFGVLTAEQARQRAVELLGEVAKGNDPAVLAQEERHWITLTAAARDYLATHVAPKRKPNTYALYKRAIELWIVPKLGRRKLNDVSRADVAKFHHSMRAVPYMANRSIAVLGAIYSWAGRCGLVPENFNPARRIEKFRENRRERFLSREEFARLGAALRDAETAGIPYEVDETKPTAKHAPKPENRRVVVAPDSVAAIRLLMLTGCRLREILNLRWREVDFERALLLLENSKTGRKTVVLGEAAMAVLAKLPRAGDYVFPGGAGDAPRSDLKRPWKLIRRRAGLQGLRIHDLRHSYASVAAGAGLGLPIIGKLLGHSQPSTTQRYAHLADDPLRQASEKIAESITAAMG